MSNEKLIYRFYDSFGRGDSASMIQCYHPEIHFQDPVFGPLQGEDACDMWRMLVRPGIRITCANVRADAKEGSADWVAEYQYGPAKRHVINRIHASFIFQHGLIIRHTDKFDLWKWSRQALGLPGVLLGWSPVLKGKIRGQARQRLKAFQQKMA